MTTGTQQTQGNGKAAIVPTQAAVPEIARDNSIRGLLERAKPKLAEVMPRHLSADRLVRVTLACIARTPALGKCTQTSLLNSVMQAAQLGLEPTGVLGSAYLVPYGNECTLIPGYRGLIDLARRSGQIESIEAHVVHESDKFTCRFGLDPVLEHEPAWKEAPGPFLAVYAIAKLKDGGRQIEVMTKAQIDGIKNRSKSGSKGPWVSDYEEMARKTVVRRICKYLPLTPELTDALALDDNDAIETTAIDVPSEKRTGVAALKALTQPAPEEPSHDPVTGEVTDDPTPEEQAEIAAREAAEAAAAKG